jgi:hypothetical protein
MAINPNTNFTAGAILTADQQNRFPRGVMAYSTRTTGFTATTTFSDVGVSVTFTAATGRNYKISFHCIAQKETTQGTTTVALTDSANTQIQAAVGFNLAGTQLPLGGFVVVSPAAGSVTYKLRAVASVNTSTIQGAATNPIVLLVEDLGPA